MNGSEPRRMTDDEVRALENEYERACANVANLRAKLLAEKVARFEDHYAPAA